MDTLWQNGRELGEAHGVPDTAAIARAPFTSTLVLHDLDRDLDENAPEPEVTLRRSTSEKAVLIVSGSNRMNMSQRMTVKARRK